MAASGIILPAKMITVFIPNAKQMAQDAEPKILPPKVYYLKSFMDKGTNWDISAKIRRHELKVDIIVEGFHETVQVLAGT